MRVRLSHLVKLSSYDPGCCIGCATVNSMDIVYGYGNCVKQVVGLKTTLPTETGPWIFKS